MKTKSAAILCSLFVLGGCTPVDAGFGEALRWDLAQQVIDPDPQHVGEPMEGGSGVRAEGAIERYEEGTVPQPATISSTTTGSGSGPN